MRGNKIIGSLLRVCVGAPLLLLRCNLALRERTSDGRPYRRPIIELKSI